MNPAASAIRPLRADAQRNRARIADAAREVLARDGLDAGMDEIARAAGLGVGTLYRHFPAKGDLIEALIAIRFERIAERARTELDNPDPWQGFSSMMHFAAELQAADRGLADAQNLEPEMIFTAVERSGLREAAAALIARGNQAGVIRDGFSQVDIGPLMCGLAASMAAHPHVGWQRTLAIMLDGVRATDRGSLPPITGERS